MNTRFTVHFADRSGHRAIVYVHCDEFAFEASTDVRHFLEHIVELEHPCFQDSGLLAARHVVWLAAEYSIHSDQNPGQISAACNPVTFGGVQIVTCDPDGVGDIYRVVCQEHETYRLYLLH